MAQSLGPIGEARDFSQPFLIEAATTMSLGQNIINKPGDDTVTPAAAVASAKFVGVAALFLGSDKRELKDNSVTTVADGDYLVILDQSYRRVYPMLKGATFAAPAIGAPLFADAANLQAVHQTQTANHPRIGTYQGEIPAFSAYCWVAIEPSV